MHLVFLYGAPAVGKLTVARELARKTGLALFHNHLTVDLVASLFEFGTAPFVELRERIWIDAFRLAVEADRSLIFTFNPEATVRVRFVDDVRRVVDSGGGNVLFVELCCSPDTIEARIESEGRSAFGKLNSLARYRELHRAGAFDYAGRLAPDLVIDTGEVAPPEAGTRIAARLAADVAGRLVES